MGAFRLRPTNFIFVLIACNRFCVTGDFSRGGRKCPVLASTKDFRAEITQVCANRLWLQHIHASSPTLCTTASKPGRQSIGFLTESNLSPYQHCGHEVMPGDIILQQV